jgi:hypothetical protein
MAHYAILDSDSIVTQVIVGKDENEPLPDGYTSWEDYYGGLRTSYNTKANIHQDGGTPFRGNFAAIGYKYDAIFNVFIPPKLFSSWKLNYTTFVWEPPVAKPDDIEGYKWLWSEPNQEWIQIAIPQN